ncbi:AAA family ATPase [Puniceicoccales bacterium CK1056]|uniref:AAA family ATPase n=1 Tax=Oceanipulchritudo coccoides TaxID=2706888 RepID=A0A6B2M161_9BACT|nr:AAA family ATPase [Oceanipulchritudo coccoides]NDV61460.1 AAA family ATPase [Oceanipulchritudo coccoides]
MARKIAFINYKGGVGKTSCIVNIAASLANSGKRVLLVDLDAQSNTSIWLMRVERWNELNTTGQGSVYSIFQPGEQTLKDIVVKDVVEERGGEKILPGLDLLPTTFDLIDLEHEYTPPEGEPVFVRFWEQLQQMEADYDYILFDCPPNVLRASQCGLFCANEVIVPANPDALSLIGFTLLTGKLVQFNERSAGFRSVGMGNPAMINGIIFNSIKAMTDIEVPKMRMQFRINQFRNQKKISPKTRIFNSMIRDAIVVRRAVTLGLPVLCIGNAIGTEGVVDDYENLTREIESLAGLAVAPVNQLNHAETA